MAGGGTWGDLWRGDRIGPRASWDLVPLLTLNYIPRGRGVARGGGGVLGEGRYGAASRFGELKIHSPTPPLKNNIETRMRAGSIALRNGDRIGPFRPLRVRDALSKRAGVTGRVSIIFHIR